MKLVRQSHWHWSKPNPNTTGKLQIGIRTSIQACKRCEYVSGGKPADFLLMIETIECNELQTNEIHIMWSEYVGWVWPSQLPLPLIVAEDAQFTVSIGHMFFQHFTLSFCHSIYGFFLLLYDYLTDTVTCIRRTALTKSSREKTLVYFRFRYIVVEFTLAHCIRIGCNRWANKLCMRRNWIIESSLVHSILSHTLSASLLFPW